MGIKAAQTEISYILIDNGTLIKNNLERLKISRKWVMDKLHENGLKKDFPSFLYGS